MYSSYDLNFEDGSQGYFEASSYDAAIRIAEKITGKRVVKSDSREDKQVPKADGLNIEQEPKYTTKNGKLVNRDTGETIPDDEPVFIFRAKDQLAAGVIDYYRQLVTGEHAEAVAARVAEFRKFARENPELIRWPDTKREYKVEEMQWGRFYITKNGQPVEYTKHLDIRTYKTKDAAEKDMERMRIAEDPRRHQG